MHPSSLLYSLLPTKDQDIETGRGAQPAGFCASRLAATGNAAPASKQVTTLTAKPSIAVHLTASMPAKKDSPATTTASKGESWQLAMLLLLLLLLLLLTARMHWAEQLPNGSPASKSVSAAGSWPCCCCQGRSSCCCHAATACCAAPAWADRGSRMC
jgi:hypothetical protein